ncbi:MAG: ATP-grasp domain-containing protein [Myxococcota bacterium]
MRHVVFVAPYPIETTMRFVRALRRLEDVVLTGIVAELPRGADADLYEDVVVIPDPLHEPSLADALDALIRRHGPVSCLEAILEPLQVSLARLRRQFDIEGTDETTAVLFRDKEAMKLALEAAEIPVARHATIAHYGQAEAFARDVGFPLVVKPPAGMACKATWRIEDVSALRQAVAALAPRDEEPLLAEEFLQGHERSFDGICLDRQIRLAAISHYDPPCLDVMRNPWIQWTVTYPHPADTHDDGDARVVGERVLRALGLERGFFHLEWFRRTDGTLAVGEVAARPPGAQFVRLLGLAHDCDLYRAWARVTVDRVFDGPWAHEYAVGCAYLRGIGRGRVLGVDGVEEAQRRVGAHIVEAELPELGARKRTTYEGDGYAIARDPSTDTVQHTLRTLIETIRVRYG